MPEKDFVEVRILKEDLPKLVKLLVAIPHLIDSADSNEGWNIFWHLLEDAYKTQRKNILNPEL